MIPKRELGKTGLSVTQFSLGGQGVLEIPGREDLAEAIINRALDLGINYIDTSPTYGSGTSENNIGRIIASRRSEAFLACKTVERSYDGVMRDFEGSLKRLRTDHLDLYQLHRIRTDDDFRMVMASDGALKAFEELRSQGVIRFVGITSHKDPDVLLSAIREYSFDCLLMTLNAGDVHYKPFQEKLLPEAVKREMGVIAMKVTAVGRIFRKGGITTMKQALGYVLSHPVSTAIVGISSVSQLEENVQIASDFKSFSAEEMSEIEALTASYSDEVNFFKQQW